MRKKLIFNQKGFTFIELLLAAGILTFVFSSLLLQLFACILLNESNRNFTVAVKHIQFVMEDIRKTLQGGNLTIVEGNIDGEDWNWDAAEIKTTICAAGDEMCPLSNEEIKACCCVLPPCSIPACTDLGACTVVHCTDPCDPNQDPQGVLVVVGWEDRGGRFRFTYLSTLLTEPTGP